MRQFVVGTAGHIDHGKSALVKALTGTDPDRLEEEKRRGMTIDLGFAHLDLPSGRRVGIVDVPGHERLIKTMLAGAAGIDLVLFVIASDEGVMPQTREHLDILRFLNPPRGVVVLSKIDLVGDPDWLALVREEAAKLVKGTFLEGMPVIHVSARTGQGLDELVRTIDALLDGLPPHPQEGFVRLPIDRSFTMPGFGTVVTGTLWSGRIRVGDVLELFPAGKEVRVRHIQSYGQWLEEGIAGTRIALNLAGVGKEEVKRGDVLVTAGAFRPTTLLDVRVDLLPDAPPVPHMSRLRFYLGTAEAFGRLTLLDREVLQAGESAIGQMRMESPVVAARGDPFVLRRYSPLATIGGGKIIFPYVPRRRHGDPRAIEEVLALEQMDPVALVEKVALEAGFLGISNAELMILLGVPPDEIQGILQSLIRRGSVTVVGGKAFHTKSLVELGGTILSVLSDYHRQFPWRLGMPREELKVKVFRNGDDRLFAFVLEQLQGRTDALKGDQPKIPLAGRIEMKGPFLRLPHHQPMRTETEEACIQRLLQIFRDGRFSPPSKEEALGRVGGDLKTAERIFQAALDEGLLIEVKPGMPFAREVVEEIQRLVIEHIQRRGEITVAGLRDLLGTSRKYALSVLEYLDAQGVTKRIGDRRVSART